MKTYRKPKWSDPAYELPNVRLLTFYSRALKGRGDVTLFLPDGWESLVDMPLVVMLHGVHGSHWAWVFNGGAHRLARRR